MKSVGMLSAICLVLTLQCSVEAGWPGWKFWKKNNNDCVDVCVEDHCVDRPLRLYEESSCLFQHDHCVDDCCDDTLRDCYDRCVDKIFKRPRHWLTKVCGDVCCDVDLCVTCDDGCVPDSCCTSDGCCDLTVDTRCQDRAKQLAMWIYRSQTECSALERARAVHRIGTGFRCDRFPEVMCALMYAMRDCEPRVRVEAADEIGDQLRKSRCCCSQQLISVLSCALNDENWRVRREAAQALRLCGLSVPYRDGRYCVDGCLDGCCDGCLDGCVTGCLDSCCETDCVIHSETAQTHEEDQQPAVNSEMQKSAKPLFIDENPLPIPDQKQKLKKDGKQKAKPAPPANKEELKGKYVPNEDDTTFFLMPNLR